MIAVLDILNILYINMLCYLNSVRPLYFIAKVFWVKRAILTGFLGVYRFNACVIEHNKHYILNFAWWIGLFNIG